MKSYQKLLRTFGIVFAAMIIGALALQLGMRIYTGNYYRCDEQIIGSIEKELEDKVEDYSDENGTVFLPEKQIPRAVIVFYPGGKVEYRAYSGLLYKLASMGYICILPKMPSNLAVFNIRAVEDMMKVRPEDYERVKDMDWYLAGHSLGGVAASKYLKENMETGTFNFTGLILCGSYTTEDLSEADIRFLSVYGDRDKVLKMEAYEQSKSLWPADSKEVIIEGGIHSYFGSYGIQNGDGEPAITNEEQISRTADIIVNWIVEK